MTVLADWAAIAIDHARLFHALAQRSTELERAVEGLQATTTIARALDYRRHRPHGASMARLRIPALGMNKIVVNGSDHDDLQKGPGLYTRGSAFPGMGRPVAIAGHRTTYGAPFLHIDRLRFGNAIILELPYGRFEYRVTKISIVQPDDWSIVAPGAARPAARATAARSSLARPCGTRSS